MAGTRLFLFDDRRARRWAPFTLTRPVGELLFGCLTLRARAERALGVACEGHVTRHALRGFDEPDAAPTIPLEAIGTSGTRVLLSSRAALSLARTALPDGPRRLEVDGEAAGWILPDGADLPSELWLREPDSAPAELGDVLGLGGTMLGRPWDLVSANADAVRADVAALWRYDDETPGVVRIGGGHVSLGDEAEIEPGVHVDTRHGPVRLDDGARVEGPARLVGPLYVGRSSRILGGHVGTSSIGPVCLVRGEVADSVLLGFVNKAHDGYIGHAMLGRWVNLGAFTTNSDLKNNYRPVHVWTPDGDLDTGLLKVGCFVGDHVKTGIGTILNTGTIVGAGSNVFGGVMPPTVVPPFSWGTGPDLRDHNLEKFLTTTTAAMGRRSQELTPGVRRILEEAWDATAGRRAQDT
jgi:UDP-N-acetylglucosamine diphosphorylase/glucosamine-1-phosphate N-acetyltransferase